MSEISETRAQKLAAHFDPVNLHRLSQKEFTYTMLNDDHISNLTKLVDSKRIVVDKVVLDEKNSDNPSVFYHGQVSSLKNRKVSMDRSHFEPVSVAVSIQPMDKFEVSEILKYCNTNKIPVLASGTKTGLEGGSLAIVPGVVLDMSRMSKILEVDTKLGHVIVEPGVEKLQLAKYLEKLGFFFAVDPGSNACLGGYAMTCASGTLFVKYKSMRENVIQLQMVLPNGEIIEQTQANVKKSSAGFNLTQLFIGSEGLLGVVTKLTLRIIPLPSHVLSMKMVFQSTENATLCVEKLSQLNFSSLARAELMNQSMMEAVVAHSPVKAATLPTLLLDFHTDSVDSMDICIAEMQRLSTEFKSLEFSYTHDMAESGVMWQARRDAYFAALKIPIKSKNIPEKQKITIYVTDVAVPINKLSEMISYTENLFAQHGVLCPIAAHACEGNFHCFLPYDELDPEQVELIKMLNKKMVLQGIALGGTCTGEHGVGMGKMEFVVVERGEVSVNVMRRIKAAIDPNNIMNPYKVFTPLPCEGM